MKHTVFFSWQADRTTREGRNLIQRALESAVERVRDDLDVEPAVREELALDKDTEGVAGSPPIFQTILGKIDKASVFVADLTFCGTRPDGRPTPNPNVLIEYGWALKALGHFQVLAVMNTAYGDPASLPFDLASFRHPMQYSLTENASDTDRASVREQLARELEKALKVVFESEEFKAKIQRLVPPLTLFKAKQVMNGKARVPGRRGGDVAAFDARIRSRSNLVKSGASREGRIANDNTAGTMAHEPRILEIGRWLWLLQRIRPNSSYRPFCVRDRGAVAY
jgi:hypothetical protein